ncbi:phosphate ABC transporter permease PstA [Novosphingobium sp. FSY-8]|uniref:Phosphate transport system permease protein PstA n=1 Tax=Novosphingobium ovatum TaxID=1908523 RepID=A0ABW9X9I4_9SPHN|nr:phosphate ABC transporter permease PstA [Novosphingobium ovatum]NBC35180.1 phosphate ABC transporter permease PstA [Novosphingobium ovatum]
MSAPVKSAGFDRHMRRKLVNYIFVGLTTLATLVAVAGLVMILGSLMKNGLGGLGLHIFTMDQPAAGTEGGLKNAILGSLVLCAMGMIGAVVVGILAGTWLAEYGEGNKLASAVRFLNDVLLSAPSILVGLFIYEILVAPFGGFSAIAGAAALACLAAPVVTRTTEDILRLQANHLREAGMALGAGKGYVIRAIIWRASRTGLVTGALLGFARISGETAPLLFTALGNAFTSWDLTQPIGALPKVIYDFANSPYDDLRQLAWVGALLISFTVLSANIIGRALARGSNK